MALVLTVESWADSRLLVLAGFSRTRQGDKRPNWVWCSAGILGFKCLHAGLLSKKKWSVPVQVSGKAEGYKVSVQVPGQVEGVSGVSSGI